MNSEVLYAAHGCEGAFEKLPEACWKYNVADDRTPVMRILEPAPYIARPLPVLWLGCCGRVVPDKSLNAFLYALTALKTSIDQ